MATPNLDQVLAAGNASNRDARIGNTLGFGRNVGDVSNPAATLTYIKDPYSSLGEIHIQPVGPNASNIRTVLHDMGVGVWIKDDTTDEIFFTTSSNGVHCSRNITAHMSVAGRLYVESTEGFVKAFTFLCAQAGILRFLGEEATRPQMWLDQDVDLPEPEFVFNNDNTSDPSAVGSAPIRAENVVSSKGSLFYNENLAGGGPGMRLSGLYNVDTVEMPNLGSGDPSLIRVTYSRPITEPVVVVTPYANNLSNGDPITGYDPSPIIASLVRSRPEYFEVMLWQALCTPEKVVVKNYGFNVFNDIGFNFHVSSPISV